MHCQNIPNWSTYTSIKDISFNVFKVRDIVVFFLTKLERIRRINLLQIAYSEHDKLIVCIAYVSLNFVLFIFLLCIDGSHKYCIETMSLKQFRKKI